jgi:hypothetical protein
LSASKSVQSNSTTMALRAPTTRARSERGCTSSLLSSSTRRPRADPLAPGMLTRHGNFRGPSRHGECCSCRSESARLSESKEIERGNKDALDGCSSLCAATPRRLRSSSRTGRGNAVPIRAQSRSHTPPAYRPPAGANTGNLATLAGA